MIHLNFFSEESDVLASIFGCNIAQLLINTYRGTFSIWRKYLECWNSLVDKVEKRLQGWKSKLLSIGGRVTLFNTVISAIYTLCIE